MDGSESDELIHVRLNGFHTALHRGDGVTLSLQSHTLSIYRAESVVCQASRAALMKTGEVASENENFVRFQFGYSLWSIFSVVHDLIDLVLILISAK